MDALTLARHNWTAALDVVGRLRQELTEAQMEERKTYLIYQSELEKRQRREEEKTNA